MGSVAIAAALFSAFSLAVTQYAWAQQPAKLPKVAILALLIPTVETCGANYEGTSLPCFMDAMRGLGYVDGKNVSFELRSAEEGPGATAAANATSTIPIIVGPGGEETLTRLAGNLAHPTGNVTGFTLVSAEQHFKCLQLLKELSPRTSRVAFLVNPDNPADRDYPGVLAPAR